MGQIKEYDQSLIAVRICPTCAKAFFALENEIATCDFCGTPITEFP